MSSGNVLRETRERKGYDLTTVARRLRIRPDILRAIESGDFSSMPPRGYTRNMVNAYARLLGLNPTEIVNMYLDEAYANQVEKARGKAPSSGFVMDDDVRRRRARTSRLATGSFGSSAGSSASSGDSASQTGRLSRHLYDDRTQYSRDDYGVTRERVQRQGRSERDFMSHHSGYSTERFNYIDDSTSRSSRRAIHVGQTPMEYSASRLPAIFQSRLAVGIAVAAIIILILVIVFFVVGRGNDSGEEDVSQLPVSGISDTTGVEENEEDQTANVEVAPTSARIVYSVASGDECYVEIYEDDKLTSGITLTGPVEETAETTGRWTITTWSPDMLKLTVNGEEAKLEANTEYGGMYAYTVDFSQILEQWRSTHGSSSSKREAAVASAANAASQSSESSSSASASTTAGDSASGDGTANTGSATTQGASTADGASAYGYDGASTYGYGDSTGQYDNGYGASQYGYDDGTGANYGNDQYGYGTTDGTYGGSADGYTDAGVYGYGDGTGAY